MAGEKFNASVAQKIGMKAMFFCSNPDCSRFTTYTNTADKVKKIGEAAHMNAASKGGPRPLDPKASNAALKKPENGIWLCGGCHDKVDDDETLFTVDILKQWKDEHEELIRHLVGLDVEQALVKLTQLRKATHVAKAQEFLDWLGSKRSMVYELGLEHPTAVRYFMDDLRSQIRFTQTRIDKKSASEFYDLLKCCEVAAIKFFDSLNKVDLDKISWERDEKRIKFENELKRFRESLDGPIKKFAKSINHEMEWLLPTSVPDASNQ